MRTVFYSSITLRKEEKSKVNIIWRYYGAFEGRHFEKTIPNEEEISTLSPRQRTVSQVDRDNGKIVRIVL